LVARTPYWSSPYAPGRTTHDRTTQYGPVHHHPVRPGPYDPRTPVRESHQPRTPVREAPSVTRTYGPYIRPAPYAPYAVRPWRTTPPVPVRPGPSRSYEATRTRMTTPARTPPAVPYGPYAVRPCYPGVRPRPYGCGRSVSYGTAPYADDPRTPVRPVLPVRFALPYADDPRTPSPRTAPYATAVRRSRTRLPSARTARTRTAMAIRTAQSWPTDNDPEP
jgi:hypothetical protein